MLGHRKCRVAAVPHHVKVVGVEKANQTCEAFLNHASYPLQGKKKKQLETNLDDINHTADACGPKYILVQSVARVKMIPMCMPNNINYIYLLLFITLESMT